MVFTQWKQYISRNLHVWDLCWAFYDASVKYMLYIRGLFAKSFRVYMIVKNPLNNTIPDKLIRILLAAFTLIFSSLVITVIATQTNYIEIRTQGPYYIRSVMESSGKWSQPIIYTRDRYSLVWNLYITLAIVLVIVRKKLICRQQYLLWTFI